MAVDSNPSGKAVSGRSIAGWCVAVFAMVAVAYLLWHGRGAALFSAVLSWIRGAGAPIFFTAMSLLPAAGFPLMPFALAAGPAFGTQLGIPAVIGLLALSVAANVSLTYWIGTRLGTSALNRICARFGWRPPTLAGSTGWRVSLLVRLAPGLPFSVQSYILASLRVPFSSYLVVSTLVPSAMMASLVVFGEAIMTGNAVRAVAAVGSVLLIVAVIIALRRRNRLS